MRAAMAWRGVLPLMGGASASAVAVATRPTPIQIVLYRPNLFVT
jgi:hypothetical protein